MSAAAVSIACICVVIAVLAAAALLRKKMVRDQRFSPGQIVVTHAPPGQGDGTPYVVSMATGQSALNELKLLAYTLRHWHPNATLVVMSDTRTPVARAVPWATVLTCGLMQRCEGKNRAAMEGTRGTSYSKLFTDYCYAKSLVMEHVFATRRAAATEGVWFLDADIVLLAPLPDIPRSVSVALTADRCNGINGQYNAGMLFMRDPIALTWWRQAGYTNTQFFEQRPLDDVAKIARANGTLLELMTQDNVGWWVLFFEPCLPPRTASEARARITTAPNETQTAGLLFDGLPMRSAHFHAPSGKKGAERNDAYAALIKRLLRDLSNANTHAAGILAAMDREN